MPEKIRVHERALAHLSRGLYRSPASAIRELVSNAWDANATRVSIDTNFPTFLQLVIEDNGDGFTREEFERLMGGGIGNSQKRTDEKILKFGRPTIGRLGIGMLGIAQICGSFTVSSRPAAGEGFRAVVQLYDLAKARMDEPDSELVHDATTTVNNGDAVQGKIVDVGQYDFDEEFDQDDAPKGTRIIATDVIPTFSLAFQDSLKLEEFKEVPLDWRRAVTRTLHKATSLQLLGDYWRLLWELSASCPVPYLADDAVPRGAVRSTNQNLVSYNFSLSVDGRQLFKPLYLKGNEGGYTTKVIDRTTKRVYGQNLTYSGYVVVQEGQQLKPDELRGLLVRIKNVGIGYYDPSMLDYRVNQGPRSRWVTGEIYVEEGLEDALNIDRDSFNRFHPEFRALQEAVHAVLQDKVFPEVYQNIEKRSEQRRLEKIDKRDRIVRDVFRTDADSSVRIVKSARATDESEGVFSAGTKADDNIEITVPRADTLPTSKSSQQLAQSLLGIFEVSLLERNKEAQRKKFTRLLVSLLKRW